MKRIPIFRGEFGYKVRFHAPWVHALPGPKVVEIEEGEEALYPNATQWFVMPRGNDDKRHGWCGWARPDKPLESFFAPKPFRTINLTNIDIVICPRKRNYGSAKNWPFWQLLIDVLECHDLGVFAAGAPDSSYDVTCRHSWSYSRFLDASLEAIHQSSLVIATSSGLASLALMCGKPLLVITHKGLVAPGTVINSNGHIGRKNYWPIPLDKFYHPVNHLNAPIELVDGWETPMNVAKAALELLKRTV